MSLRPPTRMPGVPGVVAEDPHMLRLREAEHRMHTGHSLWEADEKEESIGGDPGYADAGNKVGLRDRLKHFTWPWFIATMSTGGVAILLAETPHRFRGLYTIGVIIFLLNLVLFTTLCLCMLTRLLLSPARFLHSFTHPPEMFFFGAFPLSIATLLGGIQCYAIRGTHTRGPAYPWLLTAIYTLYWLYAALALTTALTQYWIYMSRCARARLGPLSAAFNAGWFLSGYAVMLTGTIAGLIAPSQPAERRMTLLISCIAFQGFGWTFSLVLIAIDVAALLEHGLPPPDLRPGMFIPLCAPAYTITALISISRSVPRHYGYFATHSGAPDALAAIALAVGVFLWVFGFWIFGTAVLSCAAGVRTMRFRLQWWALVFPNVGFSLATINVGRELGSQGVLWIGSVMTVLVVVVWLGTLWACGRAVVEGRVLWPGRDEDKDM